MRYIDFGVAKPAMVDDADYEWLSQFTWHNSQGYPQTHVRVDGVWKTRRMHQLITPAPKGLLTDHINRVKWDNRRCNLRHVDHSVNGSNRDLLRNNTSGITGLSWHRSTQRWCIQTAVRGKNYYIGSYKDKQKAIQALVEFKDRLAHDPSSIPDKGPLQRNNTSGITGIYFSKAQKKWVAQLFTGGKRYHIGTFTTLVEALTRQKELRNKHESQ